SRSCLAHTAALHAFPTRRSSDLKNDPTGEKHRAAMRAAKEAKEAGDTERERRIRAVAQRWSSFCVFELRSATGDKQRQDVLPPRSEEHTSELQSRENLVCRLLLE